MTTLRAFQTRVTENIGANMQGKKEASKGRVALTNVANQTRTTRGKSQSAENDNKPAKDEQDRCLDNVRNIIPNDDKLKTEDESIESNIESDESAGEKENQACGGTDDPESKEGAALDPSAASDDSDDGSCMQPSHQLPELARQYFEMSISEDHDWQFGLPHSLPCTVQDIDADDMENPQLVAEYIKDIYAYLLQLEDKYQIRRNHLSERREISGRMRAVLIDWLFQVHLRFKLLQETMYLGISIMDRYLQESECSRKELQLVGVASLLIATKFEEMYVPEVNDFVYITDRAYSKSEILEKEQDILTALKFEFGRPYPLHFLRRYSKAWEVDAVKHTMAKYLMMVSQTEYSLAHVAPSRLAAAALCLSAKLGGVNWDQTAKFYSVYSEPQLKPVMCVMAKVAQQNFLGIAKYKAVAKLFQQQRHMFVAMSETLDSQLVRDYASQYQEVLEYL